MLSGGTSKPDSLIFKLLQAIKRVSDLFIHISLPASKKAEYLNSAFAMKN